MVHLYRDHKEKKLKDPLPYRPLVLSTHRSFSSLSLALTSLLIGSLTVRLVCLSLAERVEILKPVPLPFCSSTMIDIGENPPVFPRWSKDNLPSTFSTIPSSVHRDYHRYRSSI